MSGNLELTVSVPADEWAYNKRRLVYLEALLMRILRDGMNMREWFTAGELAGHGLPGLPDTPEAVRHKAARDKWRKRKTKAQGAFYYVYHVTSLPTRAFDALVSRILDLPGIDETVPLVDVLPPMPERRRLVPAETNTAPSWVLPLMRIMKQETAGDLSEAWQRLPERLPPEVALPSVEEAAAILVKFGIAGRQ